MCRTICRECKECVVGPEEDGSEDVCLGRKNEVYKDLVTGKVGYKTYDLVLEGYMITGQARPLCMRSNTGKCKFYESIPPSDAHSSPAVTETTQDQGGPEF